MAKGDLSTRDKDLLEVGDYLKRNPSEIGHADFFHSVLCQVALPRRRTDKREFERKNGRVALMLQSGTLMEKGELVRKPLPFGSRSRLILIHVCTYAVRNRTRVVPVGRSLTDFMRRLGISPQGNEYPRFRAQLEALAACRMTIGLSREDQDVSLHVQPIERFTAWRTRNAEHQAARPYEIELSQTFYESLVGAAVPLVHEAVAALKGSSLALDIYMWLAHRLRRVHCPQGVLLSWNNLQHQFGQEYRRRKDFKREFYRALKLAQVVYPEARVTRVRGGIRLYPSPSPVREKRAPDSTSQNACEQKGHSDVDD